MNSTDISEKINQYKRCLNKVNLTKNNLISSINILKNVIESQNKLYKIDDNPVNYNYLNNLLEKENSILSNINENIIPNINRTISNLNKQYIDTKQKEALESVVGLNG